MQMAEVFFYAEAEGLLPTRMGRINATINDIKNYHAPSIDEQTFIRILHKNGLDYHTLSPKEIQYIEACIR